VLSFAEVESEPHITERGTFFADGENLQPAPAPRFSRSRPPTPTAPAQEPVEPNHILQQWNS
jgi:alpha-methylacyl-CoA racemase